MTGSELGKKILDRRRALHLTQEDLAERVGIQQSNVSSAEHGRFERLSKGKLLTLLEFLGIDAEAYLRQADQGGSDAVCPNPNCPRNTPYMFGDTIVWKPTLLKAVPSSDRHCCHCGDVLKKLCKCGASIQSGSFCVKCGLPFIPDDIDAASPPDNARVAFVEDRRRQTAIYLSDLESNANQTPQSAAIVHETRALATE